jgi:hypothetical protein
MSGLILKGDIQFGLMDVGLNFEIVFNGLGIELL